MSAPDRYRLERAGGVLHAGTAEGLPNLTKPELRALAATARALAASAEAEIDARRFFPATLPPWLVMQWLPLREVPAALRVASWWRGEAEQYFCRFAQYHGLIRVDSWQDSVRCYMEWYNNRGFTSFQHDVFFHYAEHWAKGDSRFIPIDEVVAAHRECFSRKVRRSVVSLVCFGKLNASPTGGGHRLNFQVDLWWWPLIVE